MKDGGSMVSVMVWVELFTPIKRFTMDCGLMMTSSVDSMYSGTAQHSAQEIGATITINIKARTIIMGNHSQNYN